MSTNLLFPHSFKRIGWILLIPATLLGIMVVFFNYQCSFLNCKVFALCGDSNIFAPQWGIFHIIKDNLTNELAGVLFLIAAAFIAFSREKIEDEYVAKLRLESLLWATYMSCAFLLACFILVYGSPFLLVMVLSLYLLLIVFIVRFNILLNRSKHNNNEK